MVPIVRSDMLTCSLPEHSMYAAGEADAISHAMQFFHARGYHKPHGISLGRSGVCVCAFTMALNEGVLCEAAIRPRLALISSHLEPLYVPVTPPLPLPLAARAPQAPHVPLSALMLTSSTRRIPSPPRRSSRLSGIFSSSQKCSTVALCTPPFTNSSEMVRSTRRRRV